MRHPPGSIRPSLGAEPASAGRCEQPIQSCPSTGDRAVKEGIPDSQGFRVAAVFCVRPTASSSFRTSAFDLRRSFRRGAASWLRPPIDRTYVSASPIELSGPQQFVHVRLRSCGAVLWSDHAGDRQLICLRARRLLYQCGHVQYEARKRCWRSS